MKLTITFQMDNSAFDEDCTGEAARILRDIAQKLVKGDDSHMRELCGRFYPLRDINGNTIGSAKIEA